MVEAGREVFKITASIMRLDIYSNHRKRRWEFPIPFLFEIWKSAFVLDNEKNHVEKLKKVKKDGKKKKSTCIIKESMLF